MNLKRMPESALGSFQNVPHTQLKVYQIPLQLHQVHGKDHYWTLEFGKIKSIFCYETLHYQTPRRWFHPWAPRQFIIQDILYLERRERLPAWDEVYFKWKDFFFKFLVVFRFDLHVYI